MTATAARRKSGSAAVGGGAANGGKHDGASARAGGSGVGGATRQRMIDPSLLMMSSKAQDEGRPLAAMQGGARHKSSERLHRAANSSTNLTHSKRSKSYSQIMAVTDEAQHGTKKGKTRKGRNDGIASATVAKANNAGEEDEGWTSADQTIDATDNQATRSKSDDELDSDEEADEGLVFGKRDVKVATTTDLESVQSRPSTAKPVDSPATVPTTVSSSAASSKQERSSTTASTPFSSLARQSSEETLAVLPKEEAVPTQVVSQSREEAARPSDMARQSSSASVRTLTADRVRDSTSSPTSTRSVRKRMSLMPRESSMYAAPPQLSTEYAFAGGSGQDQRSYDQPPRRRSGGHRATESSGGLVASSSEASRLHDRSSDITPHYRFSTGPDSHASSSSTAPHRSSSISSSRSSYINMPGVSPSLGNITQEAANAQSTGSQTSRALEAMQRASVGGAKTLSGQSAGGSQSAFALPRQRTKSWQSSTGSSEAARLANKLRMSRDGGGDGGSTSTITTNASRMLANSGSKYFTSIRSDGPTAQALARYSKPTVSTFVRREDDFQTVERIVAPGSLFDDKFARANLDLVDQQDSAGSGHATGKGSERDNAGGPNVRHVMDYGLSGPAIHKTATTQALLSTCLDDDEFEASWAPALAQAAGLGEGGTRAYGGHAADGSSVGGGGGGLGDMAMDGSGGGGVFINGPNATPLHFLHGLTTTTETPFPLDEADVAMPHDGSQPATIGAPGEYVDAKNLRAVALTWAALNTAKNHIITRRYVDPMRESLERVSMAAGIPVGGRNSAAHGAQRASPGQPGSYVGQHPHQYGGQGSGSGAITPGGSLRWGWRSLFPEHPTQHA